MGGVLDRVHLSDNILNDVSDLKRRLSDVERFMLGGSSIGLPDSEIPWPDTPGGAIPIRGIIVWSGRAENTTAWAICDGQNGTPDLRYLISLPDYFYNLAVTDNFIRADTGPPPSDAWSMDATEADGLVVDTNQCAGESAGRNVAWRNEPLGFEIFFSVRVAVLPGDGESIRIYAPMSAQDTGSGNGYMLEWTYHAGTDDEMKLYRVDAGVATLLNTGGGFNVAAGGEIGLAFAPGFLMGHAKADSISDWSDITDAADETYQEVGFVGMDLEGTTVRVDQVCILSLCHMMRVA